MTKSTDPAEIADYLEKELNKAGSAADVAAGHIGRTLSEPQLRKIIECLRGMAPGGAGDALGDIDKGIRDRFKA